MPVRLTIITGPPGSGKTGRLLERYRRVLADSAGDLGPRSGAYGLGATLWLSPNWRAAAMLRDRLLGGGLAGCFRPGVMTFSQFAETVLQGVPVAVRPLGRLMKRHLVRRLIEEELAAGRLRHFRPIARTGGLVDLVCSFLGELKRLEIWPEQFRQACVARGMDDKDTELLAIYEAYQRWLTSHNLYDAEGRFWLARDRMRQEMSAGEGPVGRLRLVVADGFTDFTRTEHEILEMLVGRAEEVSISLPLEGEPRRIDLFAKPLKTLAELRRRHAELAVVELPRPAVPAWPAMAHLEQALFGNPRQAEPAADASGIEILAAARPLGEIERVGARIKRLLAEGHARPGDIAVVFRGPEDADGLVGEVFASLGIPAAFENGPPLARVPALAALVALVQLDIEDWPFRRLLAVLGSNYFQPDWPEWDEGRAAARLERAVRRHQIARGRDNFVAACDLTPNEPSLRMVHRLATLFDELPLAATLAGWAKAWRRLAEETGLVRAIHNGDGAGSAGASPSHAAASPSRINEAAAWSQLLEALTVGDQLAGHLGEPPPELNREEALDALLDTLAGERLRSGGDECGRVRVLSASSARTLRVPHLFLAGLSEKAFPAPMSEGRLYGDAEYQRLIDEGLPLVAHTERSRDEMLLFYEAVTRASERLYLSYPALDEAAQPLSPSPYLKEVEQACGAGRIARSQWTDLSPIPAESEPLCASHFRLLATASALDGDPALLADLCRLRLSSGDPVGESLLTGLTITHLRQGREGFSAAEGILPSEEVCHHLAKHFGPERTFSATELEQYAACPYRFLVERVMKLAPVEDLALAVDYLERGRLAHELLAALHQRINVVRGRPTSPAELDEAEYEAILQETIEEVLPRRAGDAANALREVDRRSLLNWVADYRRQHAEYDKLSAGFDAPLRPALFEVSFGRRAEKPPSTPEALELVVGRETLRLSGRIDRIDVGQVAGQTVIAIVDYKTGGVSRINAETVAAGAALQLPLYALAATELILSDRDSVPWQAGYWQLREKGFSARQALKMYRRGAEGVEVDEAWEATRGVLGQTIERLVRGLRGGEFPVHSADEHCTSYCPLSTICRINQVRSLEKTWPPTTDKE